MDWEMLRRLLAWCAVLNMGILLWWYAFLTLAHDWTYRWHSRFIQIDEEQFNRIHYQGLMWFKLLIFFFNIVPYLVLRIIL